MIDGVAHHTRALLTWSPVGIPNDEFDQCESMFSLHFFQAHEKPSSLNVEETLLIEVHRDRSP